jgi:hypothetical protein
MLGIAPPGHAHEMASNRQNTASTRAWRKKQELSTRHAAKLITLTACLSGGDLGPGRRKG